MRYDLTDFEAALPGIIVIGLLVWINFLGPRCAAKRRSNVYCN